MIGLSLHRCLMLDEKTAGERILLQTVLREPIFVTGLSSSPSARVKRPSLLNSVNRWFSRSGSICVRSFISTSLGLIALSQLIEA